MPVTTRVLIAIAFLALGCAPAVAQPASTTEAARRSLTGGATREWILRDVRTVMGSGDRCSEGEAYRFSSDGALSVLTCENGRLASKAHRWEIAADGPYDLTIKIDGDALALLFKTENGRELMTLRRRSEIKTLPTEDRIFRLSAD